MNIRPQRGIARRAYLSQLKEMRVNCSESGSENNLKIIAKSVTGPIKKRIWLY